MIFHLSDWFPKSMIWAIIAKFDQIRKNWWRISCAEILKVGKNFFAASSVHKMSRFDEVSPEKFKKIVTLLGLAGYELIITNSAYGLVGYIYQLISGASLKNNCLLLWLESVKLEITWSSFHAVVLDTNSSTQHSLDWGLRERHVPRSAWDNKPVGEEW